MPEPHTTIGTTFAARGPRGPVPLLARLAALSIATAVQAQTVYYVDDDATPAGDGTSWELAFYDLQEALDAAAFSPGLDVEIRVAGGLYIPDLGPDGIGYEFDAHPVASAITLTIRGGFAGLANRDQPDLIDRGAYVSVLSGDANSDDITNYTDRDDNARCVIAFRNDRTTTKQVMENLTIRAGHGGIRGLGTGPLNESFGGGVHVSAPLDLNPSNSAYPRWDGSHVGLTVRDCTLAHHYADIGGAIGSIGVPLTIEDCLFVNNDASGGGAVLGVNTWVWNHRYAPVQAVNLARCSITDNARTYPNSALAIAGTTSVNISQCTIRDNGYLALWADYAGIVSLDNTLIVSYFHDAIRLDNTSLALNFCTFAVTDGHAIVGVNRNDDYPRSAVIANSIIDADLPSYYRSVSVDLEGVWEVTVAASRLGPQAAFDDQTVTLIDPLQCDDIQFFGPGSDYRLRDCGLDAATPVFPSPTDTDLAGNPRVFDSDRDGIDRADIGAFELTEPLCQVDLNWDGRKDAADFLVFLDLYAAADPAADYWRDGRIDTNDFFRFLWYFERFC